MARAQGDPSRRRRIVMGAGTRWILALGLVAFASASRADVVYSYTGPAFNSFVGVYGCAPICRITGTITLPSALPANQPALPISPSTYRFTDGNQVFDPTTVQQVVSFQVGTDATGRPSSWDITLKTNTSALGLPARAMSTTHGGFERDITTQDAIQDVQPGGNASCSNCTPGVWSPATAVSSFPHPSGLILLVVGSIAVAGAAARKVVRV